FTLLLAGRNAEHAGLVSTLRRFHSLDRALRRGGFLSAGGLPVTTRHLLRRLGQVPLMVAGLLVLAFLVIHLAPGDPVVAVAGEHGDAAYYAFMRARFGLDRPLPERLLTYVVRLVHGDLGVSFVQGRPVLQVVAERLPATLLLMVTALVLSSVVGVLLGITAARYARRPADLVLRITAVLGSAMPVFWLAQVAAL